MIAAQKHIFRVGVVFLMLKGEPRLQTLTERRVEHAFKVNVIVVPVTCRYSCLERILWRLGKNIDVAPGRVTAEQGALRAAMYFHALDIEHRGQGLPGSSSIRAVDMETQ